MRALPLLLAVALGCGGARPTPPPSPVEARALSPAQIAARGLPAVVTIRTGQSLGSGFIVRADGWIATNLHVIAGGAHVRVTLRDGRELEVLEVLAARPDRDLALVRVEAQGLPTLALGDSDAMRPGDPVVAIGNPLGLEATVSDGLVSARRRVSGDFEVLQVSAPIAPGSSGGPIINDRGLVIGVSTAVVNGGQNLAFGVPSRELAPMLKNPEPLPLAQFAALMAQLRAASAPKPRRSIPHHPVALLDGCPQDAQRLAVKMLGEAIEAGSPLFNAGKPEACYHVYDGAASDLTRKLPPACAAASRTLGDAQKRAAALGDPVAEAWAMRDAFDGLLDVIARRQEK